MTRIDAMKKFFGEGTRQVENKEIMELSKEERIEIVDAISAMHPEWEVEPLKA